MVMKKLTQLSLFEKSEYEQSLNTQELLNFTKNSKSKSTDLSAAIVRLVKAKRYHEIASSLSKQLINLRLENEKLKEELFWIKKGMTNESSI